MKTRRFDDFMRLMAVVTGMWFMLMSFPLLLHNERPSSGEAHLDSLDLEIVADLISVIGVIYMFAFTLIAHKQFWRITYARAFWCYVLTALVYIPVFLLIFGSAWLMYYAAHHPPP
jgi:hypothetical protein